MELNKEYYLFEVLPDIYYHMFYAGMDLLKNRNIVEWRLEKLKVVFEVGEMIWGIYDSNKHLVHITVPLSWVQQNSANDKTIDTNVLTNYIYQNVRMFEIVIHELFHGLQVDMLTRENRKIIDQEETLENLGKTKHLERYFEKGSLKESIFQFKKQGITLDDLKQQLFQDYLEKELISYGLYDNLKQVSALFERLNNSILSLEHKQYVKKEIVELREHIKKRIILSTGIRNISFSASIATLKQYIYHQMLKEQEYQDYIKAFENYWDKDKKRWKIDKFRKDATVYQLVHIADLLDQIKMLKYADMVDKITKSICV